MFEGYSEDERMALVVCGVMALVTWGRWHYQCLVPMRPWVPWSKRRWLVLTPYLCAGGLWWVLRSYAASDVRESPAYLLFYLVMGAAWLGMGTLVLGRFWLNVRDDAVERGNLAVSWAVAGALVGMTACYAGGNMGDGPGWWVVLFSGGLAVLMLLGGWVLLAATTEVVEHLTVERDGAAGLRVAGLAIGCGLTLGRAAAGDWVSMEATVHDFFRMAWPSAGLFLLALAWERWAPLRTTRDSLDLAVRGGLPGLVSVLIGLLVVAMAGRW